MAELGHCKEELWYEFVRFLSFKFNLDGSYTDLLSIFNITNLNTRRVNSDNVLVNKLFTGAIECPELLSQIGLHVPSRPLRGSATFHIPFRRTEYAQHSAATRIAKHANTIDEKFDYFGDSLNKLRLLLK